MNKAIKGVILSGLVYPGLGQMVFRRYVRGALLMATASISLFFIVKKAMEHALVITEKILDEGLPMDLPTIIKAAHESSTSSESLVVNLLALLLLSSWLFGAIDAFRIGKKLDLAEEGRVQSSNGGRDGEVKQKIEL